jgi:Mitochondrial carrier protein
MLYTYTKSISRAGEMIAALLTPPLDVVRTRLQSDFYQAHLATAGCRNSQAFRPLLFFRSSLLRFRETFQLLSCIYRVEGWRTLFKCLGPNFVSVVPSSAIKFYTYSNSKRMISEELFGVQETALVHLITVATAGVATSTATNMIWLVTRLPLDRSATEKTGRMNIIWTMRTAPA